MQPIGRARHLGTIAIVFVWAVGAALTGWLYRPGYHTLSKMVTQSTTGTIIFGVMLLVAGPMLYVGCRDWLVPRFSIQPNYLRLMRVTLLLQFIIAFIPDTSGISSVIHNVVAYVFAFLMLFLGPLLMLGSSIRGSVKAVCWSLSGLMWLIFFYVLFWGKPDVGAFVAEALFIVVFHLIILATIYFG